MDAHMRRWAEELKQPDLDPARRRELQEKLGARAERWEQGRQARLKEINAELRVLAREHREAVRQEHRRILAPQAPPIPVPGLSNAAKRGATDAMQQALTHGLETNSECLLTLDAKTGQVVYNKVAGSGSHAQFPGDLVEFLERTGSRSIVLVHNHPQSSAFSDQDVTMLSRFGSVRGLFVVGHDGTKYYLGAGRTGVSRSRILAEYEKHKTIHHYQHYQGLVLSGKLTPEAAWKEHSHRIMEGLSRDLKLVYVRWNRP